MDRRLAQRNLTAGLLAAGLALFFFGLSFLVTVFYLTRSPDERRSPATPALRVGYVPAPSWLPVLTAAGLAGVFVGLFAGLPYVVAGAIVLLASLRAWLRDTGRRDRAASPPAAPDLRRAAGGAAAAQRARLLAPPRATPGRLALGGRHPRGRALGGPDANDVAHREDADELSASTTTRWRMWRLAISIAARSRLQSGAAEISMSLMCSPTDSESGSSPLPSELRMSRSLMIRGPGTPRRSPRPPPPPSRPCASPRRAGCGRDQA